MDWKSTRRCRRHMSNRYNPVYTCRWTRFHQAGTFLRSYTAVQNSHLVVFHSFFQKNSRYMYTDNHWPNPRRYLDSDKDHQDIRPRAYHSVYPWTLLSMCNYTRQACCGTCLDSRMVLRGIHRHRCCSKNRSNLLDTCSLICCCEVCTCHCFDKDWVDKKNC